MRTGTGQWYDRKHVAEMCDELSEFCIRPSDNMANGVGHQAFVDLMVSVPFIACAHGGGIFNNKPFFNIVLAYMSFLSYIIYIFLFDILKFYVISEIFHFFLKLFD